MRKQIISPAASDVAHAEDEWLDLEAIGRVELTSEDANHPIEFALVPGKGSFWKAAAPGEQTVRLVFDQPQRLRRIRLRFIEPSAHRTQEFALRWSDDGGKSFREVVRQQYTFSPQGATSETEDYRVELAGVAALELTINPDISDPNAHATLAELRLA